MAGTIKSVVHKIIDEATPVPSFNDSAIGKLATAVGCAVNIIHWRAIFAGIFRAKQNNKEKNGPMNNRERKQ